MAATAQRILRYSLFLGGIGTLAYLSYKKAANELQFSLKNIHIINPENFYTRISVGIKNPSGLKFPMPKIRVHFYTGGQYIGTAESVIWQLIEGRRESIVDLYGYIDSENLANTAVSLALSATLPKTIDYKATLFINKIEVPIEGTYML